MALPNSTGTSTLCKTCGKSMPPIRKDVYLKHRGCHEACWKELKELQDNFLCSIGGLTDEQQVEHAKEFKRTHNLAKRLWRIEPSSKPQLKPVLIERAMYKPLKRYLKRLLLRLHCAARGHPSFAGHPHYRYSSSSSLP